jgi:glycine reductase
MAEKIRVLHYVNQFFAGLGGEEKAGLAPGAHEGAVGAARALQQALGEQGEVVATVYCGDNHFAEQQGDATEALLRLITQHQPQLFIAGPAFEGGRYGVACGAMCEAVQKILGIPAVSGMDEDNAGAELYHKNVYIMPAGRSAAQLLPVLQRMVALGLKLVAGEQIGRAEEEGYIPRGIMKLEFVETPAAERAVDMLLAKVRGNPFQSESTPPKFGRIAPADPIRDLSSAVIALVTDGGLVPEGNPERMESARALRFGALPIQGVDELPPDQYDVYHSGADTSYTNRDPHRLVPLDVMRELEREGAYGALHNHIYATAGIGADVQDATRTGRAIAEILVFEGVDGVILTST